MSLRPAISICVLTRALFPRVSALHLDFRLREAAGQVLTNDLQVHLLELSKLQIRAEEVYHASVVERWAWFLRHAEELTVSDVRRLFPDPEFTEAAEVLEMVSQTPAQRMLHDARVKLQRDEESRLRGAHPEGLEKVRQEGRQEGLIVGRILLLQQLLEIPQWREVDFAGCSAGELKEL